MEHLDEFISSYKNKKLKKRYSRRDGIKKLCSSFRNTLSCASDYFGIEKEKLTGKDRHLEYVFPRQICIYEIVNKNKKNGKLSWAGPAELFRLNHATVMNNYYCIKNFKDFNPAEKKIIEDFIYFCNNPQRQLSEKNMAEKISDFEKVYEDLKKEKNLSKEKFIFLLIKKSEEIFHIKRCDLVSKILNIPRMRPRDILYKYKEFESYKPIFTPKTTIQSSPKFQQQKQLTAKQLF